MMIFNNSCYCHVINYNKSGRYLSKVLYKLRGIVPFTSRDSKYLKIQTTRE